MAYNILRKFADEKGGSNIRKNKVTDKETLFDISQFDVGNEMDMQKYLLETGLKNIFDEYNKQIASLDQRQQKDIQDAYYVRELSKKYIGEYASNVGIGDVSGQILDLYGKYQDSVTDISERYNLDRAKLDSLFSEEKQTYNMNLLGLNMALKQEKELETELDMKTQIYEKMQEYNNVEDFKSYIETLGLSAEEQKSYETAFANRLKNDFSLYTGFNPKYYLNDEDIEDDARTYISRDGKDLLVETTGLIDDRDSGLYQELIEKNTEVGRPFAHNGQNYIKVIIDSDYAFKKLKTMPNPETIKNTIEKGTELFTHIDNELKGKSGGIKTSSGWLYYEYNKESGNYEQGVGIEIGNAVLNDGKVNPTINGIVYSPKGDKPGTNVGWTADLENKIKSQYFNGNTVEFEKYKNKNMNQGEDNYKEMIVTNLDNKYYLIIGEKVYELEKDN